MNPNKHKPTRWKDLELCKNCGDKEFGPDVVDRKTGLCAECLVGALERENKELRVTLGAERKDYHRLLAKSRCYEEMKAKLAGIEKDLRDENREPKFTTMGRLFAGEVLNKRFPETAAVGKKEAGGTR